MSGKPKKPTGVASLVCGIAGLVLFLLPYFGIVLSIVAIVVSRKIDTGMAKAGKIMGIIGTIINGFLLLMTIGVMIAML